MNGISYHIIEIQCEIFALLLILLNSTAAIFSRSSHEQMMFHGVDIPSAGVAYLNVLSWGFSKMLDMIV